ncbi:P-loop NTPase fold protein [Haemophilus haemolyticus]|uniref:Putative p-loop containing nucleoside triphosphate hydrolase n=1 Tax=Haemophilus haemolyticus M19501 TaxID=1028803 RepID=F9GR83_HAEHA|nr:P-loop NTPase fold protein [Haemophilus haemolyticus]EGT74192.1 putative p-loop containing nucleoside triphosphate hydrolase [Haemophilus haemolyticus M19501]
MNKHIEKYLDLYLEREDVEYATLLTGKWGCGKTYFIKNYIEKKSEEKKYKFIYISLFGLKDITSVNDAIFEELHPILSHKGIKIAGGILKSALSFGGKLDLIGDANQETAVKIDLSKLINPLKNDTNNYKSLIFIFDDLERTLISTTEILGFINSICDSENVKTIIIANEDEIDKNDEKYKRFKEKVIGKSFVIHNDNKSYWKSFDKRYSSQLKKYTTIISIIKSTFERFGNKNYRNLIQITDDYIDFTKEIKSDYLDNDEFIKKSIRAILYTITRI